MELGPEAVPLLLPSLTHVFSFAFTLSALTPFSGGQFLRLREKMSCLLDLEGGGGKTEWCSQLLSSLGWVEVSQGTSKVSWQEALSISSPQLCLCCPTGCLLCHSFGRWPGLVGLLWRLQCPCRWACRDGLSYWSPACCRFHAGDTCRQERDGTQGGEDGAGALGKAVPTETNISPGSCLPRSEGAGVIGEPRLSLFA